MSFVEIINPKTPLKYFALKFFHKFTFSDIRQKVTNLRMSLKFRHFLQNFKPLSTAPLRLDWSKFSELYVIGVSIDWLRDEVIAEDFPEIRSMIAWSVCYYQPFLIANAITHLGLRVKCLLLLADFNQNCSVSINSRISSWNHILWNFVQPFCSCGIRGLTDGWTDRQIAMQR